MDLQLVDRGGARVGALGRFEQARLGELLQPWILEAQLRRRVPSAALYTYAPDGADGPLALDGGLVTAPLGPYGEEQLDRLASELDVLVLAGPVALDAESETPGNASGFFVEGLGEAREARVPTAWHAVEISTPIGAAAAKRLREALPRRSYVSVVSGETLAALRKAGVKRKVAVVPDPLLLASEVFPAETLERRLRYLRSQGWLPGEGRTLVLDASALLERGDKRFLAEVRGFAAREGLEIAVIETAPEDDGEAAVALAEALGTRWRVPRASSITDLLAAISGASLFVSCSIEGAVIARSFGVKAYSPERPERTRKGRAEGAAAGKARRTALERALRGPAGHFGARERAVLDGHFDRLAEIVRSAGTAPGTEAPAAHLGLWRALAESRTRQVAEQRLRLAEQIERTESESRTQIESAEAHANITLGEKQRVEEELATSLRALERFRQDLDWSRMETHRQREAADAIAAERDAAKAGVEAAKVEAVRALEAELRAVHERAAVNIAAQEQAHARTIAALEEVQAREVSMEAELQKTLRAQADAHRQFEAQDSALRTEVHKAQQAHTEVLREAESKERALRAEVEKAQRAYAETLASVKEHEVQEEALRAEAQKVHGAYAELLKTVRAHETEENAIRTEMEKAQRAHAGALASVKEHETQEKALRTEAEKAQKAYAATLGTVREHEAQEIALRAEMEKAQRAYAETLASVKEHETREKALRAEAEKAHRAYAELLATVRAHETEEIALRAEMEKAQHAHAEALASVKEHEAQEEALRAEAKKAHGAYADLLATVRAHEARESALGAEVEKAQRAHADTLAALRELDTREGMVRAELRDVSRERTRLDRELAETQHERDELRANAESWRLAFLRVEGEVAETNMREAQARELLQAEHARLQDESAHERTRLESERDLTASERDALASERITLIAQRDGLASKLDALSSERDLVVAQRDKLHADLSAMSVEFRRTLDLRIFRYTAPVRALYKKVRGLTVSH